MRKVNTAEDGGRAQTRIQSVFDIDHRTRAHLEDGVDAEFVRPIANIRVELVLDVVHGLALRKEGVRIVLTVRLVVQDNNIISQKYYQRGV